MTMYEVIWIFNSEFLGVSLVPEMNTRNQRHPPYSYVRICPKCGRDWSRVIVKSPNTKYVPESRVCERCGPGLMNTYEEEYNPPDQVILHDLVHSADVVSYETHLITGGN